MMRRWASRSGHVWSRGLPGTTAGANWFATTSPEICCFRLCNTTTRTASTSSREKCSSSSAMDSAVVWAAGGSTPFPGVDPSVGLGVQLQINQTSSTLYPPLTTTLSVSTVPMEDSANQQRQEGETQGEGEMPTVTLRVRRTKEPRNLMGKSGGTSSSPSSSYPHPLTLVIDPEVVMSIQPPESKEWTPPSMFKAQEEKSAQDTDIGGILGLAVNRSAVLRPGTVDFLKAVSTKFKLVFWTRHPKPTALAILEALTSAVEQAALREKPRKSSSSSSTGKLGAMMRECCVRTGTVRDPYKKIVGHEEEPEPPGQDNIVTLLWNEHTRNGRKNLRWLHAAPAPSSDLGATTADYDPLHRCVMVDLHRPNMLYTPRQGLHCPPLLVSDSVHAYVANRRDVLSREKEVVVPIPSSEKERQGGDQETGTQQKKKKKKNSKKKREIEDGTKEKEEELHSLLIDAPLPCRDEFLLGKLLPALASVACKGDAAELDHWRPDRYDIQHDDPALLYKRHDEGTRSMLATLPCKSGCANATPGTKFEQQQQQQQSETAPTLGDFVAQRRETPIPDIMATRGSANGRSLSRAEEIMDSLVGEEWWLVDNYAQCVRDAQRQIGEAEGHQDKKLYMRDLRILTQTREERIAESRAKSNDVAEATSTQLAQNESGAQRFKRSSDSSSRAPMLPPQSGVNGVSA